MIEIMQLRFATRHVAQPHRWASHACRCVITCAPPVKTTAYFDATRMRPDRSVILDAWIERAIQAPFLVTVRADGRIRRWVQVPEMENQYLRVILLPDGETVHNAFFDRGFVP